MIRGVRWISDFQFARSDEGTGGPRLECAREHSTVKPSDSSDPPNIPGYELLEKIGEGGMGQVYRAIQLSLRRTVAVKFLTSPTPLSQTPISAFQQESRLMASLVHPNIVAIHDCGYIQGEHYLVMEYVAGTSLHSLMKPEQPWTVVRAAPVLDAIARALSYIHGQGILHLDLKPENVLCGQDGLIKITDFGLSLPGMDSRTLSQLGWARGTIDYCAPEQRYGLRVDQRTDLFALATLAYELLTGHLPGRVYRPASQRNPYLPPEVDDVLRRGLARDPDERYASVEDFRAALILTLQQTKSNRLFWIRSTVVGLSVLLVVALVLGVWLSVIRRVP